MEERGLVALPMETDENIARKERQREKEREKGGEERALLKHPSVYHVEWMITTMGEYYMHLLRAHGCAYTREKDKLGALRYT